ncbi:hypothetical protein HX017_15310 [Myroides marinus]|uniref:hypothetical protein n=1 Tax=Myroides marinus TaxID=703342 RepID=UPI002577224C|nr:hypothetical protein [Myroides marinus]MDM1366308.1 hypothetical protein [Myroides marinus]
MEKIKKRNEYNQSVVNQLAKKHRITEDYVRKCLSGVRDNMTADAIKKDYYKAVKALNDVQKIVLDSIIN